MTEEQFVDDYMVSWKNMMDERGHVIPFERDVAVSMLKKNPELFKSMLRVMNLGRTL